MKTKNQIQFLVLALIAMISTSCIAIDGVVGRGSIIAEHVNTGRFTGVEVASSSAVEITRGDSLSVILSDYENLIDYWDVRVVNNVLIISTKPFSSLVNSRSKVTIVMPDQLTDVAVSGSGNVALNSNFEDIQNVKILGSGRVNGNINTNYSDITLSISGSGDLNLKGTAVKMKAVTTGSGKMYMNDLVVQNAECIISGSGDMFINVDKSLKASIIGSGDILYTGTPTIDAQVLGSGKLKHQ